ncbi:MAG: glycoside hydrolase family 43 protein [Lachnospiraceae bacterium]|nr:glycoside hydrolase family 43 protein [Lachnospiraceae bacterium]
MMKYAGYLFVHFIGESKKGEQIYFSVSRDGLHWEDLNHGEPVIESHVGEKGLRDPFILRNRLNGRFYIIATDLCINAGKGWGVAQYEGSRNLMVMSSENLTDWTEPEAIAVGVDGAGCVWAPEAIYDEKEGNYLTFWASMVQCAGDKEPKQRIYESRTKDFKVFSEPQIYIERQNHVIDTTIVENQGIYYRFSKDETTKNIIADRSADVGSHAFEELKVPEVNKLMGVEGPLCFPFNDRDEWCLMVDRFATDGGYLPIVTGDMASGQFRVLDKSEYDMGKTKKRHGSVLNITEEEYDLLVKKFGKNLF